MAMKPFTVAISIGGIALLMVGASAIKSKIAYDNDEQAITKLIAEYKALGVPTNGAGLQQPISPSLNAWTEIGPMLLSKQGNGTGLLFKSGEALELLLTCSKQDLPLIKKYLAENKSQRDKIEAALNAKPKLQILHDYDEGFSLLLPEFAAIRPLIREYCLAAYAAGIEGNMAEVKRNLDLANRFVSHCAHRTEFIAIAVEAGLHKNLFQTGFQIIQANPSLSPQIQKLLASYDAIDQPDFKLTAESEFVAHLATARYFDSSELDHPTVPKFLEGLFKQKSPDELMKLGGAHHGDYIPTSHAMRAFLRSRLEMWLPWFQDYKRTGKPSVQGFERATDFMQELPSQLAFMAPSSSPTNDMIFQIVGLPRQHSDLAKNIFRAMEIKEKSGKYPTTLDAIGIPIQPTVLNDHFTIESSSAGITIKGNHGITDGELEGTSLSFPVTLSISPKLLSKYRDTVKNFRLGRINVAGTSTRATKLRPPPIPPGAPPRAP